MKRLRLPRRVLIFLYAIIILLFCHHFIFRPIFLDWGSPESIRSLSLPGDTFTSGDQHTRAVLINATPQDLWPWLIQIGQERGGFYSHAWLENLFRADMQNVYSIEEKFQQLRTVGDTVWLANKEHYNGSGYQIVARITPNQAFVMVGGDDYKRIRQGVKANGSWAFYLYPHSDNTTWLIARSSNGEISTGEKLLRYLTFEVPHFIMEVRMLKTMKKLAENV